MFLFGMKCRTKLSQSRVGFNHGANFFNKILIFPSRFLGLLDLHFNKQGKLIVWEKKRPGLEARKARSTINGSVTQVSHMSSRCLQGEI